MLIPCIFSTYFISVSPYTGPLLARVTDALYPTVGYFELGLNLGMALSEIKVIEHDHKEARRRLIEVINWWLEREDNEESHIWRKIIECLELMGKRQLARQISERVM